ncbi:hypothetical protein EJB05_48274, partial [Eragrostis curvula]
MPKDVIKVMVYCTGCSQRELLLSPCVLIGSSCSARVKDHLQALRKYTYGKHIVSRVEQLCGDSYFHWPLEVPSQILEANQQISAQEGVFMFAFGRSSKHQDCQPEQQTSGKLRH